MSHNIAIDFWGLQVRIASDQQPLIDQLRMVYAPVAIASDAAAPAVDLQVCAHGAAGSAPVVRDGTTERCLCADVDLFSQVDVILTIRVMDHLATHVLLHAGVVADDQGATIICAPSGCGKTTLTLALVAQGYRFLSDEFCAMNLGTGMVEPFPRSVGLSPDSPFSSLLDGIDTVYDQERDKCYAPPAQLWPQACGTACVPARLLLVDDGQPAGDDSPVWEVTLFEQAPAFVAACAQCAGIEARHLSGAAGLPVVAVRVAPDDAAGRRFLQQVLQRFHCHTYGVRQVRACRPDFGRPPVLEPLPTRAALLAVSQQVLNRTPDSALLRRCGGSAGGLLRLLATCLGTTRCYRLVPGRLDATIRLIAAL